jgi:hypothetical protein
VPGGVGVMEAVFLAVMPGVPAPAVFAALLIWRLFYLILPLVMSLPVVLAFERTQLKKHKLAVAVAQADAKAEAPTRPFEAARAISDQSDRLITLLSAFARTATARTSFPERDRRRAEHQERADRLGPSEGLAQRDHAGADCDHRADEGEEPGAKRAPIAQQPQIDGEADQRAADDERRRAPASRRPLRERPQIATPTGSSASEIAKSTRPHR